MSRSKWKFKCIPTTLKKIKRKIWDRDLMITRDLIGLHPLVYNGSQFFRLKIDSSKVGHKIGEFIYTRRYVRKESFDKKAKNKK
jgi:small subunit ribosomal protein S19